MPVSSPPVLPTSRNDSPRLGREDWLDAAFDAVVDGGFDKVRVLLLADKLGVTRGSFYWHFSDHAELIAALLARWLAREQQSRLQMQAEVSDDPLADLDRMLDAALAHAGADLEHMRFELALRDLGRRDAAVAGMLMEVDRTRLSLFEGKFLRVTQDGTQAAELAALFYLCVTGSMQALSRPVNPPQLKDYLKGVISRHLIHRPAQRKPSRRA